jgi:hypothetical protein
LYFYQEFFVILFFILAAINVNLNNELDELKHTTVAATSAPATTKSQDDDTTRKIRRNLQLFDI